MGNDTREKLKKNVAYVMEQEKLVSDKISQYIPKFTQSEIEIAKLIIEGKKLKDIIVLINKKHSNITCQRSKMRAKPNLKEGDNLRDAIIKRVTLK